LTASQWSSRLRTILNEARNTRRDSVVTASGALELDQVERFATFRVTSDPIPGGASCTRRASEEVRMRYGIRWSNGAGGTILMVGALARLGLGGAVLTRLSASSTYASCTTHKSDIFPGIHPFLSFSLSFLRDRHLHILGHVVLNGVSCCHQVPYHEKLPQGSRHRVAIPHWCLVNPIPWLGSGSKGLAKHSVIRSDMSSWCWGLLTHASTGANVLDVRLGTPCPGCVIGTEDGLVSLANTASVNDVLT